MNWLEISRRLIALKLKKSSWIEVRKVKAENAFQQNPKISPFASIEAFMFTEPLPIENTGWPRSKFAYSKMLELWK